MQYTACELPARSVPPLSATNTPGRYLISRRRPESSSRPSADVSGHSERSAAGRSERSAGRCRPCHSYSLPAPLRMQPASLMRLRSTD